MPQVYVVDSANLTSEPMTVVVAKDEDKDLQALLDKNFDLLPGDQIDPNAPCQWLLVKREMPVPDPTTGSDRWNIDFFFVDDKATPTFVECKRYLDTRARREVVGQVLEYVANGAHYWSSSALAGHAESTAKERQTTLAASLTRIRPDVTNGGESFFAEVERRLKSGEVRVVFFMELAPPELKRLVEFMNAQMSKMDVLLVEARQYTNGTTRVVVPTLFGFTERIRELKQAAAVGGAQAPIATDWESFRANALQKGVTEPQIAAMQLVFDNCLSLGATVAWGRGTVTGSFSPRWSHLSLKASLFSVYANGRLELHFPSFQTSEAGKASASRLAAELAVAGLPMPSDYQNSWLTFEASDWTPKVGACMSAIQAAVSEQPTASPTALQLS